MVLEYLQIQKKLVQAFAFQPVRHESGIFRFECMKACLYRPSWNQRDSALNMKWRLAIKFQPPMSSDQMPTPGKTKLIKFPPSRTEKDVKCPGCARGGGLSSDLTGSLRRNFQISALFFFSDRNNFVNLTD